VARPVNPDAVLARRLRAARERLGLSQREVGLLMGLPAKVAAPRINQYERGSAEPSVEDLQRLAEALGVPAPMLVAEDPALVRLLAAWADAPARSRQQALRQLEADARDAGYPARSAHERRIRTARDQWEHERLAAARAARPPAARKKADGASMAGRPRTAKR
jgi:transcriptional regulator with XRE-family HTH domain